MTKPELWKIYTDNNPTFAGDGQVTMTAAGLRKLFDQTWEQAYEQGKQVGEAKASLKARVPGGLFDDLFRGMF